MTDTEILNKQEELHIQVWQDYKSKKWTAFKAAPDDKHYAIQPTKSSLREALVAGIETPHEPHIAQ